MVGRVARCGNCAQHQTGTEFDLVAGREPMVRELEVGSFRCQEHRPLRGELGAARDVVGMRVRVGGKGDLEAASVGFVDVAVGNAGRVDDERATVAEIDEVGRMTEALVDERNDLRHASCTIVADDASACSDAGTSRRRNCHDRILDSSTRRQKVAGCSAYETVILHPSGVSAMFHDQSAYDGLLSSVCDR